MGRRHPLPRLWLMTDERQGEALWEALRRLPRGAGIVFRHYGLATAERRALFRRVRATARARGLTLLVAGLPCGAADGAHNRRSAGLRSASAHDLGELRAAERRGAGLVFVSPVYPTRSHPGAAPLGPRRFGALARRTRLPVVALGGMDAPGFRRLRGAHGWAAIDAWLSRGRGRR
ncbi:MAG: thiamine phosphate synthase [Alphaproteobacteria bacterium]|nr:thiamine phosphate synthase [Alphaproteobacteria bacterium]MBV9372250.1 thiamine phosphate synthase [Alphaproteobacteria bacterium]MBV9901639.1 thiamine phosphate synthase [Alphaproteobacteria bacterium]